MITFLFSIYLISVLYIVSLLKIATKYGIADRFIDIYKSEKGLDMSNEVIIKTAYVISFIPIINTGLVIYSLFK